jgi:hypothetical protein
MSSRETGQVRLRLFPELVVVPALDDFAAHAVDSLHDGIVDSRHHGILGATAVPLALLATATAAVHHRCITGTAFGGLSAEGEPTRNRMESGLQPCRGG